MIYPVAPGEVQGRLLQNEERTCLDIRIYYGNMSLRQKAKSAANSQVKEASLTFTIRVEPDQAGNNTGEDVDRHCQEICWGCGVP